MSVSVSRSDGLTVLTLTSDHSSSCPPLCQLLGALCYSPGLCSKSYGLSPQRGGPQAALGGLWIITGVLHIGLGINFMTNGDFNRYYVNWVDNKTPLWQGVPFLFFGLCCVLSERYPRRIVLLLNGLLNLAGAALSITAIVIYSQTFGDIEHYPDCEMSNRNGWDYYDGRNTRAPTTMPPDQNALKERCEEIWHLHWVLTITVLSVLVTLSVLDLCVALSSATLSFKALRGNKSGNKDKATSLK